MHGKVFWVLILLMPMSSTCTLVSTLPMEEELLQSRSRSGIFKGNVSWQATSLWKGSDSNRLGFNGHSVNRYQYAMHASLSLICIPPFVSE
jgi:hypothetical protein